MRHLILLLILTSAAALDQSGAEAAIARGWAALDASNTDHTKNVDAALAFTEALGYYAEAGDAETCRELQADVYWAKKRMDADDIQTYLAAKGQPAVALVDEMKRVADAPVAVGEADAYFARAEAFAKAHATDHLRVAIRWFEVASRFPGTQAAMDAQQRSLDAQVQAKAPAAKLAKAEKPKPTLNEKQQAAKAAEMVTKAAQAGLIPVSWIEAVKYGSMNANSSVKAEVLALVGRVDEVRVNNDLFKMDPAPNQAKTLTIEYRTPSGKKLTKVIRETETFTPSKLLFDDRAGAVKIDEFTAPMRRR